MCQYTVMKCLSLLLLNCNRLGHTRYPRVPIKVKLTFLQQLGMLRTGTNHLTLEQINIFEKENDHKTSEYS